MPEALSSDSEPTASSVAPSPSASRENLSVLSPSSVPQDISNGNRDQNHPQTDLHPPQQKTDRSHSVETSLPAESAIRGLYRSDRLVLGVLLLVLLGLLGFGWLRLTRNGSPPLNVERAVQRKVNYRLDLNQASAVELEQLEGIGETLAQRIIAFRKAHGPFRRIEDLRQVSGIGPKTLEKLRPLLRISPDERQHAPRPEAEDGNRAH